MNESQRRDGPPVASSALLADEYRCAACQGVFKKGWTDEEMLAEKEANGWGEMPEEDGALVCDDCYRKMTGELTPQEFNAMQQAANSELNRAGGTTVPR